MARPPARRTVLTACALVLGASVGVAQHELLELAASNSGSGDGFGGAVGMDGGRVVAGAYSHGSGRAYGFDVGSGQESFQLRPRDGSPGDQYGLAVALGAGRVVVGSRGHDAAGQNSGSAYVYDAATGRELFVLRGSDVVAFDEFGQSVAIDGERLVVGAYRHDDLGTDSGAAYVFDATTGQELVELTASDGEAGDQFGYAVAVGEGRILVGAWADDDLGSSSGAVYVFDLASGQELAKWTAPGGAAGDGFGRSVAIGSGRAVVGSPEDDDLGSNSGSALVLDLATGQPLFELTASDGKTGDVFGGSVALAGDLVLVGAPGTDAIGTNAGSVYVFSLTTGRELHELNASDAAAGDVFGVAVATDGARAIVGAFGHDAHDGLAPGAGAAYVFELSLGERFCDPAIPNSSGASGTMGVAGSPLVADDDLVLFASGPADELERRDLPHGTRHHPRRAPGGRRPALRRPRDPALPPAG